MISLALFSTCLVLALSPSNAAPLLQTTQDPMGSSRDRSPDRPHCPPYAQSNESEGSEVIKINYQIFLTDFSKKFTHSRLVKVFCRTGYFLAVNDEKKVTGTVNTSSNRILFEWQSVDTSIVRLKNVMTGRYLAINRKGRLTAQAKASNDGLFKARQEENDFHTFASHKYFTQHKHNLFLGIKRNGRSKPPRFTSAGQEAVQFMVLDENLNRTDEKYKTFFHFSPVVKGRRSPDD